MQLPFASVTRPTSFYILPTSLPFFLFLPTIRLCRRGRGATDNSGTDATSTCFEALQSCSAL